MYVEMGVGVFQKRTFSVPTELRQKCGKQTQKKEKGKKEKSVKRKKGEKERR